MLEVVTEIVIERPFREVAEFASDPDMAPRWYDNIKVVKWRTPRPLAVGTELVFVANFMGEMAFNFKVTGISETHLEMMGSDEENQVITRYEWEALNESSTRMKLYYTSYPSGFSRILSPVKCLMVRYSNLKDLSRLKQLLESREE